MEWNIGKEYKKIREKSLNCSLKEPIIANKSQQQSILPNNSQYYPIIVNNTQQKQIKVDNSQQQLIRTEGTFFYGVIQMINQTNQFKLLDIQFKMDYFEISQHTTPIQYNQIFEHPYQLTNPSNILLINPIQNSQKQLMIIAPNPLENLFSIFHLSIIDEHLTKLAKLPLKEDIHQYSIKKIGNVSLMKSIYSNSHINQREDAKQIQVQQMLCCIDQQNLCFILVTGHIYRVIQKIRVAGSAGQRFFQPTIEVVRNHEGLFMIIVVGYSEKRNLQVFFYSIQKRETDWQIQARHSELFNISDLMKELNKSKPIRSSFEYNYSVSSGRKGHSSILSLHLYPLFIENYATIKLFQVEYELSQNNKIYRLYQKPKLYELASLHDNLTLKSIKKVFNYLAFCYTLHRIQVIQEKNRGLQSYVMIYDSNLLCTKNIISIPGIIIRSVVQRDQQNKDKALYSSCLNVYSNKYDSVQSWGSCMLSYIKLYGGSDSPFGNPKFHIELAQKPLMKNFKHYQLGLLDNEEKTKVRLTMRTKYRKGMVYWKLCKQINFIEREDNNLIQKILECLDQD